MGHPATHIRNRAIETGACAALDTDADCTVLLLEPRAAVDDLLREYGTDEDRLEPMGARVHEARTNLCAESNDFVSWINQYVSATDDSIVGPDGTLSGCYIDEIGGASTYHRSNFFIAPAVTAIYSFFCFLKKKIETTVVLRFHDTTPPTTTNKSCAVLDQWKRFGLSETGTQPGSVYSYIYPRQTTSYVGEPGKGCYAFGAQLELGAHPGPYIPTDGAAASSIAPLVECNGLEDQHLFDLSRAVNRLELSLSFPFVPADVAPEVAAYPLATWRDGTYHLTLWWRPAAGGNKFQIEFSGPLGVWNQDFATTWDPAAETLYQVRLVIRPNPGEATIDVYTLDDDGHVSGLVESLSENTDGNWSAFAPDALYLGAADDGSGQFDMWIWEVRT